MSAHGVCQQWFGLSAGKFCDTAPHVSAISFPLSSRKAIVALNLNCHRLISVCETHTFSMDKQFFLLPVHENQITYQCVKATQSHCGPGQALRAPRFQDIQHMKVVRLSALCTGCLNPPTNITGTHFS